MKYYSLLAFLVIFSACTAPRQEPSETPTAPTFTSPTGMGAQLPHLTKGGDGSLYLSWVVETDSMATLQYAMLSDDQWSAPETVASGDNWFVNWADYPTMAADAQGNLIAHYPAKSGEGAYAYDVNVVLKPNGSSEWSAPVLAHTDGTQTEHGFVAMLPQNDGTFLLTWLDGRFTGGGDHDADGHGGGKGAMTVRTAVIDMQGNLSEEAELDDRVCDCCQTGITNSPSGLVIVYRDRSEDEIRDMYFVRNVNGAWSVPSRIAQDNWNIAGCPVNGPRIASYGESVAVAWFTAANGEPKVKLSFLEDDSFGDPIIIDESAPLGRVDIVMLDEMTAVVSWLDGGASPAIKYAKITSAGVISTPVSVTSTSESRSSGFPQMELLDGSLYFSWTVSDGEEFGIEMTKFEL
ncbi:MAG: exo-alpha-sialidase [Cyclobacteriaceae bacterium]